MLDRASLGGTSANVVAEARNDIAQRNIDNRVNDFLRRANDRLRAGALVEPAQNNARFFIESARAIAPNQNDVRVAQRQLNDRIVASGHQPVMAFWHGRILPATYYFRRRGIVVITSENFDGEWIAGIIERFGYGTARGSTSRGAKKALLQLRRDMPCVAPSMTSAAA